jgi:hypothetical protein
VEAWRPRHAWLQQGGWGLSFKVLWVTVYPCQPVSGSYVRRTTLLSIFVHITFNVYFPIDSKIKYI